MRKLHIEFSQNNSLAYIRTCFLSTLGEYHWNMHEYYKASSKECLQMIQKSKDVDYYVFAGSIFRLNETCFPEFAFDFHFIKPDPFSYRFEGMIYGHFDNYRRIAKDHILYRPFEELDWEEQKELLIILMGIMKELPIKEINLKVEMEEFFEGVTFAMENFKVEEGKNRPDILSFINLYYDIEFTVRRTDPGHGRVMANLEFLFGV
jgi:hypothetical protein